MEENQNNNRISIVDDEGNTRICEILFTYTNPDNEKNYVVFYPVDDDNDDDNMDLFAYSFIENENGEGELFPLEDDDEYDMINDVIDQFYQDQLENEE